MAKNVAATAANPYSIKGLKYVSGHDGKVYACTLLKNGKAIGTCAEDKWGGALNVEIKDKNEEKAFFDFIKALPPTSYVGDPLPMCAEIFVHDMVKAQMQVDEEAKFEKKVRRLCETKTLVSLPEDAKLTYRPMNVPYNEKVKAALVKQYGADIVIHNEKYK